MTWENILADEFKRRDNPVKMGAIVGEVVSPLPNIKISILDGAVILEKEHLYISAGLKEKLFQAEINGKSNGMMNLSTHCIANGSSMRKDYSVQSMNLFPKEATKVRLYFKLKEGDEVLLIPTSDEQRFFMIDIVEYLGGRK